MGKEPVHCEYAGDVFKHENGGIAIYNVALIDDEPLINISTERLSKRCFGKKDYGVELKSFGSGRSFIDELDEDNPDFFDAVVTDYNMPGMNGSAVIEELRSRGYNGHVFVYSTVNESEFSGLDGVTVVQKPGSDELVARLEEHLDNMYREHKD